MKKNNDEKLEARKNLFDLARELAIIVDEIDLKKAGKKQIQKKA